MTTDHFDKLQGQAYDAGTVMEEVQESLGEQFSFSLPSCAKVSG